MFSPPATDVDQVPSDGNQHQEASEDEDGSDEGDDEGSASDNPTNKRAKDDTVKTKVKARRQAVNAFGNDMAGTSSSDSGDSSDSDDDFEDDAPFQQHRKDDRASKKSTNKSGKKDPASKAVKRPREKDDFMTAGTGAPNPKSKKPKTGAGSSKDTIDLTKESDSSPATKAPKQVEVKVSKMKLPLKHKKVKLEQPPQKTFSQTVIPTVKKAIKKESSVIPPDVASETSKGAKAMDKADIFNKDLAARLKAAKEQDALESHGLEPTNEVEEVPAPAPLKITIKKKKEKKEKKKPDAKVTASTAVQKPTNRLGKRTTQNSMQTGDWVVETNSEPQRPDADTNLQTVGEADIEHSDGGTAIIPPETVPIVLENEQLEPAAQDVDKDAEATRAEIIEEGEGDYVDGQANDYPAELDHV